ncbi:MAG: hypothetical protein E5Y59_19485, partial [Mesorhizobium sp.]
MIQAATKAMKDGRISVRGTLLRRKRSLDFVPILNPGQNYEGLIDDNGRQIDAQYDIDTREVNLADLLKWMAKFNTSPTVNPEPANQNNDQDDAPTQGRPRGRSYVLLDAPLVEQMRQMVLDRIEPS